ncbi:MAG: RICIN domain-containing protein [Polyangiaceae bacterium]
MGAKRATLGVGLFMLGCGGAEPQDSDDFVAARSSEMVDGTAVSINGAAVVAVYHKHQTSSGAWEWFGRPCTGRVLTPRASTKYILTARHCVTAQDDTIHGPVIAPSQVQVSALVDAGPNPRGAFATSVHAFPNPPPSGYLGLEDTLDLAIVVVNGAIEGLTTAFVTPMGMYMAPSATLGEVSGSAGNIEHWGYGMTVPGSNASSGLLRQGFNFPYLYPNLADPGPYGNDNVFYFYTNQSSNNAWITHGDSGGPAFRRAGLLRLQIGVHHSGSGDVLGGAGEDTAIGRRSMEWIQSIVGRFYWRPVHATGTSVARSGVANRATLRAATNSASINQWWTYDFNTKRIRIPSTLDGDFCVDLQWNNAAENQPIWLYQCSSSSAQRWVFTSANQIVHEASGKCIDRDGSNNIVLKTCSNAQTRNVDLGR